jgi:signal transduction histidine kinase
VTQGSNAAVAFVRTEEIQNQPRSAALVSLHQDHWFIRLRWAFVAVALAFLGLERFVTPSAVRPTPLVVPILLLAIVNLVWMGIEDFLLRQFRRADADDSRTIRLTVMFSNAQVAVDLTLLTVILRYTGGVENPMALFYLFHMSIGALLLRPSHAIVQGLWAMVLYSGLALGEYVGWIAPHRDFLPQFPSPGLYARGEYIAAMLVVMACGVFATLYFTLHITGRLMRREQELARAHRALTRSEAAIFDLQQRRARLLQIAAHQLKGPLACIDTLVSLIEERIVPEEAVPHTYARIRERCRDGIQQVTELLTLARVQNADPLRHRRASADVARTVREICRQYLPLAAAKGIELKHELPENADVSALIDPTDLADCLGNLVDNAIKYTTGPGHVSVTVSTASLGLAEPTSAAGAEPERPDGEPPWPRGHVAITVTDTGMGLDPGTLRELADAQARSSIFDTFRRGNNALAAGISGTGIGLGIVREAVEQCGGRIYVQSRQGQGSSFTVTIPTRAPGVDEPAIRDTRASITVLGQDQPLAA